MIGRLSWWRKFKTSAGLLLVPAQASFITTGGNAGRYLLVADGYLFKD